MSKFTHFCSENEKRKVPASLPNTGTCKEVGKKI